MALLPNTGLEDHPAGTTNVGGIINGNWERIDELFDPALATTDPNYNFLSQALTRGALPTTNARLEWDNALATPKPFWRKFYEAITYAATVTFDMKGGVYQEVTATGNLIIALSNLAPGRELTVIITASGGTRTLTWPVGIIKLGTFPTSLGSGKSIMVQFVSTNSSLAGVYAKFNIEP
jgi:hypothetical protein